MSGAARGGRGKAIAVCVTLVLAGEAGAGPGLMGVPSASPSPENMHRCVYSTLLLPPMLKFNG